MSTDAPSGATDLTRTTPPRALRGRALRRTWLEYVRAIAVVSAAAAVASAARTLLHIPDVEMLFLLGVMIVAVSSGRGAAIAASVLSVAAYDFFFVPPPWTFDVDDARYLLTFAMMLAVAVVISGLAVRVREQERAAADREQRTSALYGATRELAAALVPRDVAIACVNAVGEVIGTGSVFLLAEGERLEIAAADPPDPLSPAELEVATWAALRGTAAGSGTSAFAEADVLCIPLRPLVDVLAVLVVRNAGQGDSSAGQREFVEALCRQAALALERIRLAEEARRAASRADAEELRSSLLSSVSHDLRTPLSAITGAATTLRAELAIDPQTRRELIESICEEAERLERLVGNLLDMTRLESGTVRPRCEWVPLIEVIGAVLTRLDPKLAGRDVTTEIPDDLPLLSVDPVLIEQLFLNLLENAAKYTPPGSPIAISAHLDDGSVVVEVADRGPGIPRGTEEVLFERFRRGEGAPGSGVGLGLAIARAIAVAHGGTLTATNRESGGAAFRLALPAAPQPEPSGEAE